MPLNDQERHEWERRFRDEAEREDARRREAEADAALNRGKSVHRDEQQREAELAQLRLEVREAVWKEKGYVQYTDSRGVQIWLTPEEHARRSQRRGKRRKKPKLVEVWSKNSNNWMLFAGVLALAVLVGLVLSSR